MSSRVFVTYAGGQDFSKLAPYGEIYALTDEAIPANDVGRILSICNRAIKATSPYDYIVLSGSQSMGVIFGGMFAQRHGRLNLLLYKEGEYTPFVIKLNQTDHERQETAQLSGLPVST